MHPISVAAVGATTIRVSPRTVVAEIAHQPRVASGSRAMLHLLVGALTLVSAQMLFTPQGRAWGYLLAAPTAYADQRTVQPPAVSAPALNSGSMYPFSATQQVSGRSDVMNDLSATIGHGAPSAATTWRGMAGMDVNQRAAPNRMQPPVGHLKAGTPVEVVRWVSGEAVEPHNDTWAELADGTFVYATSLRRAGDQTPPPLPADAPIAGRWIDVNLTEQMATAYEGRAALRSALVSSGRPGWETPNGTFSVQRRIERDTMDGATLVGQGPNGAGATYKVENVRYVQYFTADGAAIHENYWRRPATFGIPGSHGCIGMTPTDAAWFWDFATVGTPLVIHD